MRIFNFHSFDMPVTSADVRQFVAEYIKTAEGGWRLENNGMWSELRLRERKMLLGLGAFFLLLFAIGSVNLVVAGEIPWNFLLVVGAVVLAYYMQHVKLAKLHKEGAIYARFARDNDLTYTYRGTDIPSEGAIFGIGHSHLLTHVTRGDGFEFGNYRYVIGGGKNREERTWGYLALTLDRHMTNILLDSKLNNHTLFGADMNSNLPQSYSRQQQLSLEGDFDKSFDVYVPTGHETEALYLLTPDIMALLVDKASDCDIEIVNDRLYVYLPQVFDSSKDGVSRALSLLDALMDRLAVRTNTYLRHSPVEAAPALHGSPFAAWLRYNAALLTFLGIMFFSVGVIWYLLYRPI